MSSDSSSYVRERERERERERREKGGGEGGGVASDITWCLCVYWHCMLTVHIKFVAIRSILLGAQGNGCI